MTCDGGTVVEEVCVCVAVVVEKHNNAIPRFISGKGRGRGALSILLSDLPLLSASHTVF